MAQQKTNKVFVLNPSQSKRLIAKGVVNLPQMRVALENGRIFIGRGGTNAYILEELNLMIPLDGNGDGKEKVEFNKGDFVAGQIVPGKKYMNWWINAGNRSPEVVIIKGKKSSVEDRIKTIGKFKHGDLFLKGANALDREGIPGVLVGSKDGGTIGTSQGILQAKGIEVICPIGLEKLVFGNIQSVQTLMGIENMDFPSEGMPCGMIPMPFATVITEIEALEVLFECEVFHVASGGVGGAEGSVSLLIIAYDDAEMKEICAFMDIIAEEPIFVPNV